MKHTNGATKTDRRAFIDGPKILRKILAAHALKSCCAGEVYPGSNVTSDEDLLEFCRQTGSTVYHPTSTCRMGNDPLAVVDQRLRLRGIEGLRVVDASIMPADVGQHQRGDDHDRREGIRYDPAGCAMTRERS